jgi:hypothetical protein
VDFSLTQRGKPENAEMEEDFAQKAEEGRAHPTSK